MATTKVQAHSSSTAGSIAALALAKLREVLHKPEATWTCDGQRDAVLATLEGQKDVISILATGSGKTMQVILPVLLCPQEVTVLILPLRALVLDYQHRLEMMNIPYQEWTTYSNEPKSLGLCNLVLLTIEQAKKQAFSTAIAALNDHMHVKRYVFDEVHYALTAGEYRDSFSHLEDLRATLPVQFVLMSGTVGPHSMHTLFAKFGLTPASITIRTKTVRPEIQYVLHTPLLTNILIAKRVSSLAANYTTQFKPEDRGLVYAESKTMLNELSKVMQTLRYEGGSSMTNSAREAAYQAWLKGTCSWMSCTSAFSAGMDYAHVRVVIFAGTPERLVDMVQEADRSGRDKYHAIALIIPHVRPQNRDSTSVTVHTGEKDLKAVLYRPQITPQDPKACLRYALSKFLDGIGTSCTSLPNAEQCSRCKPVLAMPPLLTRHFHGEFHPPTLTTSYVTTAAKRTAEEIEDTSFAKAQRTSRRRKSERDAKLLEAVEDLSWALAIYHDRCMSCAFWAVEPACNQSLSRCPEWEDFFDEEAKGDAWQLYCQFKKSIHYKQHNTSTGDNPNICFKCGVPQIEGLHGTFGSTECPDEDKIVPLAFFVWHWNRKELEKAFGRVWASIAEYAVWLAQVEVPPKTNANRVFIWFANIDINSTE